MFFFGKLLLKLLIIRIRWQLWSTFSNVWLNTLPSPEFLAAYLANGLVAIREYFCGW